MFLVDDIALFPVKSILSLFREIYKAAVQEMAEEADSLRAELGQLYQMFEAGTLDERAFDDRERQILDRLDAIEARDSIEAEGLDDDEDEDEDDEEEDDDEEDDAEEDEDDESLDDEAEDES
ncbi:gas vesicle protein GvpG (plasmid) [Tundrisphaera lichenicola]|uniref:gas vesicle protein GvpG n=1 Tax=Tundrisphaera lichenicola TaxID=2029860 RepID=UPI003EB9CD14